MYVYVFCQRQTCTIKGGITLPFLYTVLQHVLENLIMQSMLNIFLNNVWTHFSSVFSLSFSKPPHLHLRQRRTSIHHHRTIEKIVFAISETTKYIKFNIISHSQQLSALCVHHKNVNMKRGTILYISAMLTFRIYLSVLIEFLILLIPPKVHLEQKPFKPKERTLIYNRSHLNFLHN